MKIIALFLFCFASLLSYGQEMNLVESFNQPAFFSKMSKNMFRKVYEEQIKKMYILNEKDEWIKVANWRFAGNDFEIEPLSTKSTIPQRYLVEVHGYIGERSVRALIVSKQSESRTSAILVFPEELSLPTIAERGFYYLAQRNGGVNVTTYDVVPDQIAKKFRVPSLRDATNAFQKGMIFLAKIKCGEKMCPVCNGNGIIIEKNESSKGNTGSKKISSKCTNCFGKKKISVEAFYKIIHPNAKKEAIVDVNEVQGSSLPTHGLVAYYSFTNGTYVDESGNGHVLKHNGAKPAPDRFGRENNAYAFCGEKNEFRNGDKSKPFPCYWDNFTIAFWAKTDVVVSEKGQAKQSLTAGNAVLFPPHGGKGKNAGCGVAIGTDGVWLTEHADCYLRMTLRYAADIGTDWNYYTVTVENNGAAKLYINGQYVATASQSGRRKMMTPELMGGGYLGYFNGVSDDYAFYNRALTPEEIMALYNGR